jgi:flagellin
MSSLLTNASAITALQNLSNTQRALQTTQNQISTGLRVSSAADNAAYWSIATTMSSDNGALGAVKDALGESSSMIDVANAAMKSTLDVMNKIKNDLVSAKQPGADLAKIQTELKSLQAQLGSIVKSSAFNGQNWLDGSQTSIKLVAAFNRDAAGATSVDTIDVKPTAMIDGAGGGVLEAAGTGTNITTMDVSAAGADIDAFIADTDVAIGKIADYSATLGATKTRIDLQQSFVSNLSDALTKGVSALVDADMNQASTRLQALQTQQQLGVQSLSIANQNTQMILKLFQ